MTSCNSGISCQAIGPKLEFGPFTKRRFSSMHSHATLGDARSITDPMSKHQAVKAETGREGKITRILNLNIVSSVLLFSRVQRTVRQRTLERKLLFFVFQNFSRANTVNINFPSLGAGYYTRMQNKIQAASVSTLHALVVTLRRHSEGTAYLH
jgi:hypothetical protein